MKRSTSGVLLLLLLAVSACKGDPTKPEYWDKAIGGAKSKKDKLRKLDDLRSLKTLDKSFVPMLHKRLAEEKGPDIKGKVAQILGELKDPSSVDPLTDAIDWTAAEGDSKGMNKEIAIALGNIADPKAAPALLKCLNLKDNYTVIAAIEGLGQMRAKKKRSTRW
ncbi:MAG: HEAT repeat domain-containing protein [Archangiaceae bacterium]|nr:HEAT repeat domain-containing protein [Archangiaceae bacterium]